MGVSDKLPNFHFGVEYPFNNNKLNTFLMFIKNTQKTTEKATPWQ